MTPDKVVLVKRPVLAFKKSCHPDPYLNGLQQEVVKETYRYISDPDLTEYRLEETYSLDKDLLSKTIRGGSLPKKPVPGTTQVVSGVTYVFDASGGKGRWKRASQQPEEKKSKIKTVEREGKAKEIAEEESVKKEVEDKNLDVGKDSKGWYVVHKRSNKKIVDGMKDEDSAYKLVQDLAREFDWNRSLAEIERDPNFKKVGVYAIKKKQLYETPPSRLGEGSKQFEGGKHRFRRNATSRTSKSLTKHLSNKRRSVTRYCVWGVLKSTNAGQEYSMEDLVSVIHGFYREIPSKTSLDFPSLCETVFTSLSSGGVIDLGG